MPASPLTGASLEGELTTESLPPQSRRGVYLRGAGRAGRKHAMDATLRNAAITAPIVRGSAGWTPTRKPRSSGALRRRRRLLRQTVPSCAKTRPF